MQYFGQPARYLLSYPIGIMATSCTQDRRFFGPSESKSAGACSDNITVAVITDFT